MRTGPSDRVRIHYLRPPDRKQLFEQAVVLDRPDVVVTLARSIDLGRPVVTAGRAVLERGSDIVWFTFPGAWHDIGRFHLADGTFTGFYANVLTPCVMEGREWHTTDLFLDVWMGADGATELLDEPELADAVERGILDDETANRAREEADRLLEMARAGRWPPAVVREWSLARAAEAVAAAGG